MPTGKVVNLNQTLSSGAGLSFSLNAIQEITPAKSAERSTGTPISGQKRPLGVYNGMDLNKSAIAKKIAASPSGVENSPFKMQKITNLNATVHF